MPPRKPSSKEPDWRKDRSLPDELRLAPLHPPDIWARIRASLPPATWARSRPAAYIYPAEQQIRTDPPPSDAQSTTNEVQSVQTEPPPSDSQSTTNNSAVQGKGKGRASGFGMSDPADVANIVSPEPDDGIQAPSSDIGTTFQMPDKAPQATETSFPRPTLTRRRPVQAAVATPRRSQTPLITGKGPQTPAWVMGNIAASQAIHFPSSPPERTVARMAPTSFVPSSPTPSPYIAGHNTATLGRSSYTATPTRSSHTIQGGTSTISNKSQSQGYDDSDLQMLPELGPPRVASQARLEGDGESRRPAKRPRLAPEPVRRPGTVITAAMRKEAMDEMDVDVQQEMEVDVQPQLPKPMPQLPKRVEKPTGRPKLAPLRQGRVEPQAPATTSDSESEPMDISSDD